MTTTVTFDFPAVITRTVAGHTFEIDVAAMPAASAAYIFNAGFRALNDAANSAAKQLRDEKGKKTNAEAGWMLSDSRAYVDALMDGSIAEKARRAGTSALDPVTEEALRLAAADILSRLGVKSWNDAAASAVGAKYFTLRTPESGKAYVQRNVDAFLDYIKRHDEKTKPGKGYMERAEVIVATRGDVAESEIEL